MDARPATPTRVPQKRPHDTNTGKTLAPKAQKMDHEQEFEPEDHTSPTFKVSKRKKATHPTLPPKRPSAKTKARPSSPKPTHQAPPDIFSAPQDSPLTINFGTPAPETLTPHLPLSTLPDEDEHDPNDIASEGRVLDKFSSFQGEWETDPSMVTTDMSNAYSDGIEDPMNCIAPGIKKDWSIIMTNEDPRLRHYSENPFDFLTAAKFNKLTQFWRGNVKANGALSRIERDCLGETRMNKMLARVVHSAALMKSSRDKWIHAAISSITNQRTTKDQKVLKAHYTIDPAKKGYSWVIIPVGAVVFKVLENVQAAMDPRSGTLVLFRPWKNESCPIQHFFASGIHREDDNVSFEIATTDFMDQIKESTAKNKVRIMEMTPTPPVMPASTRQRSNSASRMARPPSSSTCKSSLAASGQALGTSRG